MSTLFFFGENLSLYLSWLRTNAGPVPDAPARRGAGAGESAGGRGRHVLLRKRAFPGGGGRCAFASRLSPLQWRGSIRLATQARLSRWRGSMCFRFAKPLRAAAAAPAPANMPLACLLDGAAQGFDPLTIRQNQRKTRQGKPVWSFLVPVAGVEPARCHHQWILSPPRLPIPTHRRLQRSLYNRIQDLFKEKFDIWLCTKIYFVFVMSIFHKGIFCGQNGVGDQTDTSSNCNRNFTCFLGNSEKPCF